MSEDEQALRDANYMEKFALRVRVGERSIEEYAKVFQRLKAEWGPLTSDLQLSLRSDARYRLNQEIEFWWALVRNLEVSQTWFDDFLTGLVRHGRITSEDREDWLRREA